MVDTRQWRMVAGRISKSRGSEQAGLWNEGYLINADHGLSLLDLPGVRKRLGIHFLENIAIEK
jgi:hypothetical protein